MKKTDKNLKKKNKRLCIVGFCALLVTLVIVLTFLGVFSGNSGGVKVYVVPGSKSKTPSSAGNSTPTTASAAI